MAQSQNAPPCPQLRTVIRCYPLCNSNHELAGFSLDIKSAHKRVCVKEQEHGLLGFSLDSKLFFLSSMSFWSYFFGILVATTWGWILRFFHQFIWLVHAAWLYVDDYFWIQRKDILPLTSTTMGTRVSMLTYPYQLAQMRIISHRALDRMDFSRSSWVHRIARSKTHKNAKIY